jgi:hypothetical protein
VDLTEVYAFLDRHAAAEPPDARSGPA